MTALATVALEPAAAGDVHHAVACQAVRIGYVTCAEGAPLCGTPATLQDCAPGLFAPSVTCTLCAAIAEREHITIGAAESQS